MSPVPFLEKDILALLCYRIDVMGTDIIPAQPCQRSREGVIHVSVGRRSKCLHTGIRKRISDYVIHDVTHLFQAVFPHHHVMEDAQKALVIMDILAEKGSRMAVSDVGVGVQFIRTALTGAVMNVWINTKSMKDREKAEELNRQADEMMRSGTAAADAVYQKVENALR